MGAYNLTGKFGWGVCQKVNVSDLLVYRRIRFESKKGANLSSLSLEPRRNREIGKW